MTIVVVDDEPLARNFIVRVLVRKNYSVWEADSADEALLIAYKLQAPIDLLIADHRLKKMNGRQLAEIMCRALPHLRVVHTSGCSLQEVESEQGIIRGGAFLAKPFAARALTGKIEEMFAGR